MSALRAADGEVVGNELAPQVAEADLSALAAAAIDRWSGAGLSASSVATFKNVKFAIADLSGSCLGLAGENTIYIDWNAAGHGWFIDPTPAEGRRVFCNARHAEAASLGSRSD